MLASDRKNTVLSELSDGEANAIGYTAYGHPSAEQPVKTLLGYNGEFAEPNTGWQLLGNGYRAYNQRWMRFQSPDSWSPFGAGGLNAYAYCEGDPVSNVDRNGHSIWGFFIRLGRSTTDDVSQNIPAKLVLNKKERAASVFPIRKKDVVRINKTAQYLHNKVARMQASTADQVESVNDWIDASDFALSNVGKPGITRETRAYVKGIAKKFDELADKTYKAKVKEVRGKTKAVRTGERSFLGDGNS